jgi:hypothetical protein
MQINKIHTCRRPSKTVEDVPKTRTYTTSVYDSHAAKHYHRLKDIIILKLVR